MVYPRAMSTDDEKIKREVEESVLHLLKAMRKVDCAASNECAEALLRLSQASKHAQRLLGRVVRES